MSDRLFPSYPGIVEVRADPIWVTREQKTASGRRLAIKRRSLGFRYALEVRGLRPWLNEDTEVRDFFNAHAGSYESFLYTAKDGIARRVHFTDDHALDLRRLSGGVWVGTIALETVVF